MAAKRQSKADKAAPEPQGSREGMADSEMNQDDPGMRNVAAEDHAFMAQDAPDGRGQ